MPIFLSLGSNVGDREQHLQAALALLCSALAGQFDTISAIYETEPFGYVQQPWFYNIACSICVDISPQNLLLLCKSIEYMLGRRKAAKWSERIIDIDILLYNDIVLQSDILTIPHPYLHCRRFVLAPLADIAPKCVHPVFNTTIADLLHTCSDASEVKIATTIF